MQQQAAMQERCKALQTVVQEFVDSLLQTARHNAELISELEAQLEACRAENVQLKIQLTERMPSRLGQRSDSSAQTDELPPSFPAPARRTGRAFLAIDAELASHCCSIDLARATSREEIELEIRAQVTRLERLLEDARQENGKLGSRNKELENELLAAKLQHQLQLGSARTLQQLKDTKLHAAGTEAQQLNPNFILEDSASQVDEAKRLLESAARVEQQRTAQLDARLTALSVDHSELRQLYSGAEQTIVQMLAKEHQLKAQLQQTQQMLGHAEEAIRVYRDEAQRLQGQLAQLTRQSEAS